MVSVRQASYRHSHITHTGLFAHCYGAGGGEGAADYNNFAA